MLLALSLSALAADDSSAEAPIPPLSQRVTDLTGTLSQEQQAALESRLAQFEQQKGSQIAILIVPTTQPEAIEQYSIRVVDQWRLGRKGVDDGILILVAKNDRKVRIEVGYGLEGVIPDAIANRIVEETLVPHFRQGDFYGGLNQAVAQLIGLITGEPLPEPHRQQISSQWEDMLPLLLFGGLIVGAILRAVLGNFLGGAVNGGLIGLAVWILGGGLLVALVLAFIAFIVTMSGGLGMQGMGPRVYRSGGLGGFGSGGGGFGSGGFSGGGGGFGGGGASGNW
ncbi:MAG TPA: YgcG family protein [Methylophilaceae bacterium]|nr:YgcG family protein [Methylophilaceae bacterium]